MKRVLDVDPLSGAVQTFEYDHDGDKVMVHHTEDNTPQIEATKKVASEWDGWNQDKSMRHAAHIPDSIVYEWLTKYGVNAFNKNHIGRVMRLLDSNEYRYLRIGHFHIGHHD